MLQLLRYTVTQKLSEWQSTKFYSVTPAWLFYTRQAQRILLIPCACT
ncbi:MAG: hypothetical protein ACI4IJ_07830 [Acutalibacteraceae bacterium]